MVGGLVRLESQEMQAAFESFVAIPERLEPMEEIHGRRLVNNLSGTSAESTRRGVLAFSGTPVSLVMGGDTKGADYAAFAQTLKEEETQVFGLRSEATEALKEHGVVMREFTSAAGASLEALKNTPVGGVLLFSPGAAFFESRYVNKNDDKNVPSFEEIISLLRSSEPLEDQSP